MKYQTFLNTPGGNGGRGTENGPKVILKGYKHPLLRRPAACQTYPLQPQPRHPQLKVNGPVQVCTWIGFTDALGACRKPGSGNGSWRASRNTEHKEPIKRSCLPRPTPPPEEIGRAAVHSKHCIQRAFGQDAVMSCKATVFIVPSFHCYFKQGSRMGNKDKRFF